MKKKIAKILKYTLFTSIGVLMFWLVYRDQDFSRIRDTLMYHAQYRWIAFSLILGLFSHISRTLRWKIALEPLDEHPGTINTFIAVMLSYFMNLLLPRMGEFARCAYLTKYEKIPFPKLLGTVITERIVDMIMLLLLIVFLFLMEFDKLIRFGHDNPAIMSNARQLIQSPFLWGGLLLLMIAAFLIFRKRKEMKLKNKVIHSFHQLSEGIRSVLSMKRYKAYIAHTIFIWTMYFMMLYVAFFSLEFTSHLPLIAALTTFILATLGMVAPVQAGIGAWHFMAEKALGLYGVESADGKLFALLVHSSTNGMIVVCGILCIVMIPLINRNKRTTTKPEQSIT
ncbi:MAG: flippase-like domain-containing protein [Prolixibacteraceae bacterium]|nr:flippase-like domain-containing protein [Prolixibacteraceae bacterium]